MKKLLGGLAIASLLAMGVGVGVVSNANAPVETKAWDVTSMNLHIQYGGEGAWSDPLFLTKHDDDSTSTHQWEGVFKFTKDDVFGFQYSGGKANWIGYHSALGSNFESTNGANGGDIRCKTTGVYQIWIKTAVDDYGEPFYIWDASNGGINLISDTPHINGTFSGAAWAEDAAFSWDSTSMRYKATRHLAAGDQFKFKKNAGDTGMTGYHANWGTTNNFEQGDDGNIKALKAGTYDFYLGASYWFYGNASYGFVADASSDTSSKKYYNSYYAVEYTDAETAAAFAVDVNKIDAAGGGCATKYDAANALYDGLTTAQKSLFASNHPTELLKFNTWVADHESKGTVFVTTETNKETYFVPVVVAISVLVVAAGGMALVLKRRYQD